LKGYVVKTKKGFSLMELLVVISITTLMGSIAIPTLNKVKAAADETICAARLQQWGIISQMYTQNNNGFMLRMAGGWIGGGVEWTYTYRDYYSDYDLLFCPEATRTFEEGGRNPYMAWSSPYRIAQDPNVAPFFKGSYGINLYVSKPNERYNPYSWGEPPDYWGTPFVAGAMYVPLMMCSQHSNMQPYPTDEPSPYETDLWTPGPHNEMRRSCIRRHSLYNINVLFMDFSVQNKTIKEIWRMKWHRNWPSNDPLPVWPDWMADIPNP
jgi:prepilin-type N-terminal cleavage/methylation domain-containing protein